MGSPSASSRFRTYGKLSALNKPGSQVTSHGAPLIQGYVFGAASLRAETEAPGSTSPGIRAAARVHSARSRSIGRPAAALPVCAHNPMAPIGRTLPTRYLRARESRLSCHQERSRKPRLSRPSIGPWCRDWLQAPNRREQLQGVEGSQGRERHRRRGALLRGSSA